MSFAMKQEFNNLSLEKTTLTEALADPGSDLSVKQKAQLQQKINQISNRIKQISATLEAAAAKEKAEKEEEMRKKEEAKRKKEEAEAERKAMLPPDQNLHCQDCDSDFLFSGEDVQRFADNGWALPFRCPECRQARKERRQNGEMEEAPKPKSLPAPITVCCKGCSEDFEVSGETQQYILKKGYEMPKWCDVCRKEKTKNAPKPVLINCKTCSTDFSVSVGEQNFFKEKGLKLPLNCKTCCQLRKKKAAGSTRSSKGSA